MMTLEVKLLNSYIRTADELINEQETTADIYAT